MDGLRLSALRFPLSAHDLVRKPVAAFRDHARGREANLLNGVAVGIARTQKTRRENVFLFRQRDEAIEKWHTRWMRSQ